MERKNVKRNKNRKWGSKVRLFSGRQNKGNPDWKKELGLP